MTSRSRPLEGVRQIIRYNWPFYVVSILMIVAGGVWITCVALPPLIRIPMLVMIGAITWWTIASVAASLWVYDVSHVPDGEWIARIPPAPPRKWALIHVGLDQTSDMLRLAYPSANGRVLDVFDAARMNEPSIKRARERGVQGAIREASDRFDHLGLADKSCDAIFLVMAAHEIRQAGDREQFFREIRRVLSPDGIVILIEHARDFANFLAFGPGFMHFMPAQEWRRLGETVGLAVLRDERRTPFVRFFVFGLAG